MFFSTRTLTHMAKDIFTVTYTIFPENFICHSFIAFNGISFRPPAAKDLGSDPSRLVLSDMNLPWRIPRFGVCQNRDQTL